MTQTNKLVYALVFGAAASFFIAISAGQALAADTYAQYETQADLGIITQMPGKTAKKAEPRKVNHARYEVMAEKGIFIQPKSDKPNASELAKRLNHAEYDAYNDIDG
ncbi:hypothetical protein [Magnetovibrio sp.]|uniref:hypothetical protein n=1 Tax=Magnetovibrio sp. TaxID=2024836 RepID=UPI002F9592A2